MELTHRIVETNGIRLHVAEQGTGHPVVFCHGFPHTWFMWHRQLAAVAAAGYRALAPDLRGYGRTECPDDVSAFTNAAVIGDLLGLLDDLGEPRAVFVGLDFGAALVWELALRAPERVAGLIVLNNPYAPRPPRAPSQLWAKAAQRHFLHLDYFQRPGVADAELGARPREFLARVYHSLSADYHYLDTWRFPAEGTGYLDVLPDAPALPWRWLSESEFDTLATEFERTGFTGGLNWYRNLDRNWELTADFADAKITVPTYFLYGDRDPDMEGFSGRDPLGTLRAHVPGLRAVTKIADAGHLVQLERTDEVNHLLRTHLADLVPVADRTA
ncbi:alpha/beta hydrolase [Nocardia puris]|uniref:Pimeloyl-ACP methyl ester carboxylesterase n=1 Tax=Nocardia puris TaxID=208602 RepID=A0A366E1E4_9NOCA|nr:alpha/beta hydrolase [Nocardia puris]MBF6209582.1 alpha/beta hydrolase [Nocardia puris]MBF6366154.1 alpha/beta hydrolase [Nocardia puris]MBF6458507.1 alpha/beta hydrolase [Nocardia puris]RBO96152.1 pimeloyl-ACP methyl ester carboxylesterase [Nocardia puris]